MLPIPKEIESSSFITSHQPKYPILLIRNEKEEVNFLITNPKIET